MYLIYNHENYDLIYIYGNHAISYMIYDGTVQY